MLVFPFCIRFGSPDWTRPPERAGPAVSNHGLNADGDRKHREVADGKGDDVDFAGVDPCSEENKERGSGESKHTNTHTSAVQGRNYSGGGEAVLSRLNIWSDIRCQSLDFHLQFELN